MLLSDIRDEVLMESGQFFFLTDATDPLACFGWTLELFWKNLVKRSLLYYARYRPLTAVFNRTATSAGTLGQATVVFGADSVEQPGDTDAANVYDPRVGVLNRDPGLVPEWISSVLPTQTLSTVGIQYLFQITSLLNTGEYTRLHEPRTYLFRYEHDDNHGILYVSEIGKVEITAHYQFPYEEIYENDVLTDVEILYLNLHKDSVFIDLITARFMIAVGRSRRAFTLEGNPIQYDAQEMVQEGRELEQEAKAKIEETSLWWASGGI